MLALLIVAVLPSEIDILPSAVFPKALQTTAVTGTVRVVNATTKVEGSGALIGRSGPYIYILTANHVANRADRLELSVFTGESYPKADRVYRNGEVVAQSAKGDLALVRLATQDAMPAMLRICPPKRIPDGKDFAALSVGCEREMPTVGLETVKGKRLIRKRDNEPAGAYWEIAAAQARGRSGGPLLDREGRVIGICSGVGDGKGYYTHTEQLHRFLRQHGYSWLYEESE
jgi:S1-C subfamily serine protease